MKMDIPSPVLHSLFALNTAGFEAYVVGGCVRDALMGKEPFDWDITTSALPEQTKDVFKEYRVIETGIQHGTVTVLVDNMQLEITTYRVDGDYSDGRHPDQVSFTRSLSEDLKRRDFTVNAMAYHPQEGLVDLFGGQKDLEQKCIRCVGDPDQRFHEDALRIIRGLRFAASLGFSIEKKTADAIHRSSHLMKQVAIERITVELIKLLCGQQANRIVQQYNDVLRVVLPYPIDWHRVSSRLIGVENTPVLRLGILLADCTPEAAATICRYLRLSKDMSDLIVKVIGYMDTPLIAERQSIARMLNRLGPDRLKMLIALRAAYDDSDYSPYRELLQRTLEDGVCYRIADLAINGNDLQNIGIPPGQQLGTLLNELLDAVMDGEIANDKEALLNWVTKKPVQ